MDEAVESFVGEASALAAAVLLDALLVTIGHARLRFQYKIPAAINCPGPKVMAIIHHGKNGPSVPRAMHNSPVMRYQRDEGDGPRQHSPGGEDPQRKEDGPQARQQPDLVPGELRTTNVSSAPAASVGMNCSAAPMVMSR